MLKSQALQELKQELHISHSQIFVYLHCSLKYQFMYVEAIPPARLSIALSFGSAIHVCEEKYYRSLMDKNYLEPLNILEELFADYLSLELDHSDIPVIYKKEAPNKDSAIELGKKLLKVFYESVDLTGIQIIGVELPLSAKLYTPEGEATELNLIGMIDLLLRDQNGELIVIDHKTAAKAKSQSAVDEDMQFTAYSYLLAANKYVFPTADINCRMDVLRKLKKPKIEYYYTVRTASDRKRFSKIASMVLTAIESRIFMPQKSWMCSDCGYTDVCSKW
ncbi:PD-(D/E)XK nuclease family protein [bacterium]|nr:PD-(D/E)XK nuclease family protein [bacterium]